MDKNMKNIVKMRIAVFLGLQRESKLQVFETEKSGVVKHNASPN